MEIPEEFRKEIVQLYTDPQETVSFGPLDQFYAFLKARHQQQHNTDLPYSSRQVKDVIREDLPGYTVNQPRQFHFPRRIYTSYGIDYMWGADLMYFPAPLMHRLKIGAILVCVDSLTHFIFARVLKRPGGEDVMLALRDIFQSTDRKPTILQTDSGAEFLNHQLQEYLVAERTRHQIAYQQPNKSAIAGKTRDQLDQLKP